MKKLIVKLIKLDNSLLLLSEALTTSLAIYMMLYEKTIDLLDQD